MLKTLFGRSGAVRRESLESAARAAESAGDLPRELEARRALVALDPRSSEARVGLARALQKTEPQQAIAEYREALSRGAADPDVHFQLGVLHMGLAEYQSAREHFDKVLETEPANADAMCMVGSVESDLRRYDEAAGWFERALKQRPGFSEAHFNLGLARFERADFRGAAASFSRCVVLRRGEPWIGDRTGPLGRDAEPRFEPMDAAVNEI